MPSARLLWAGFSQLDHRQDVVRTPELRALVAHLRSVVTHLDAVAFELLCYFAPRKPPATKAAKKALKQLRAWFGLEVAP